MRMIFYGWWVVLATSLIHFWGAGTFYYSFTAFFNPIVDEFGWSYAATSFAASLRSVEAGIASPLVGFATDRFGARRLLFLGSILTGFGFVLLSQINSLWSFYLVFVFISLGSSLLLPIPGWAAVTSWFAKKGGTAIGVCSAAVGVGGILVYLVSWMIGLYGWRSTLIIIGAGMWVIGIPCSLIVRRRPESSDLGLDTQGTMEDFSGHAESWVNPQAVAARDYSLRQALRTRSFWVIAVTMAISSMALGAVVVHVMPYLISINFAREAASLIASALVVASIAGRLGLGWLSNRLSNRYLLASGLLLQATGMLFLATLHSFWQAIVFSVLFGPGYGGLITIRLTLQAEYFGEKAFGAIQGTIMAITIAGTFISPLLAGMVYDLCGSYRPAWVFIAAAAFASISLALKAHPPQEEGRA